MSQDSSALNRMQSLTRVAVGVGFVALLLGFHQLQLIIVVVNLVLCVGVLGLQVILLAPRRIQIHSMEPAAEAPGPFVSVQVALYNEPPGIVADTLRHLSHIDWPHHEVLVIDNGTPDERVWRPVERLCAELGPRFHFHHVTGVPGYKAGALNHLRQFADPRTDFVFIVDSDYLVRPEILRRALAHATAPDVGLVQFPQSYLNAGEGNRGLTQEYRHFFAGYMHMANRLGCVPSTGTLTLVRKTALLQLGGFNQDTITEDAELGLRMYLAGYRSVFADEEMGQGYMPHDLAALEQQRWRWAFGNMQVLRAEGLRLLTDPKLGRRPKLGSFAHLTAWFNFNLVPMLALLALTPVALWQTPTPAQKLLALLAAATVFAFLVLRLSVFTLALRRDGTRWSDVARAFLNHLGLGWISSASWVQCLWDSRAEFVRTNKYMARQHLHVLQQTAGELALGAALLVSAAALARHQQWIAALGSGALAGMCLLVLYVARQMRWTFRYTDQLHDETARAQSADGKSSGQDAEPVVT